QASSDRVRPERRPYVGRGPPDRRDPIRRARRRHEDRDEECTHRPHRGPLSRLHRRDRHSRIRAADALDALRALRPRTHRRNASVALLAIHGRWRTRCGMPPGAVQLLAALDSASMPTKVKAKLRRKPATKSKSSSRKATVLLSGGNPQIAKANGDAP